MTLFLRPARTDQIRHPAKCFRCGAGAQEGASLWRGGCFLLIMDKGDFAKGEPSERDGLVRPARLQMASHAKTGYKASFGLSLFTLTLFNVMAITVAFMNWETSCEEPMAPVLFWYGVAGMLFVAVLLKHFCYFNELGSWPSRETATLCLLLLIIIFGLGTGLIYLTAVTRETCRLTAPILWRWCFAIVLYFALIIVIALAVPFLRLFCGCVIAPIAYACVGCAESVQVAPLPPPPAPAPIPASPGCPLDTRAILPPQTATKDLELPEIETPLMGMNPFGGDDYDPPGQGPGGMGPGGAGPGGFGGPGQQRPDGDFGMGPVGPMVATRSKLRPDGTVVDKDGRPLGTIRPEFGGMVVSPSGIVLGMRFPDGSIRAPLAGDVLAAGTVVAPDGMVLMDGRPMGKLLPWNDLVVAPNGMIVGKRMGDGTVRGLRPGDALEPATTVHPDGTVTSPDGRRLGQLRADGMVVKPDGHILGMMTPNGAIVVPGPGDVLHPNSTVTPDGVALDAQGRPLGRVMPDGVVIGPDGFIVGMLNADGFIGALPPPGANLFTGTTLKPGQQFGPQLVLSAAGRILGKLRPENNMVMGPDGQTSIGVRGPNGSIRYASVRDLDPSRGPPKAFSQKSHSMSPAQRERARLSGMNAPRCCGIPLGKLGQKFQP